MLEILRPAPIADLVDMLAREDLPASVRKLGFDAPRWAALQAAAGRSWGWRIAGRVEACAGLIPRPDGRLEAWFACRPSAARHMLPIARAAQLTLEAGAQDATVVALVSTGWRPGERLARAVGLEPGETVGEVREWLWSGSSRDRSARP